jgi:hypothetical protein
MELAEIFAVLIQSPGFVPSSGDTRVVLPVVEELQMVRVPVIESNHCEMLTEMWYPSAVDDRPGFRFRFADGMRSMPW